MKSRIEKLGLLVMEAERRLRRQFEAQTATHGLSAAQWRLLGHLLREGPSTQVALADLLDVEPISVSASSPVSPPTIRLPTSTGEESIIV